MTADELVRRLRETARRHDYFQTGDAPLLRAAADAIEEAAEPDASCRYCTQDIGHWDTCPNRPEMNT